MAVLSWRAGLLACSLFVLALEAFPDPLILHAREREKAGDLEGSAALLSSWLASNPAASASPAVFAAYLRIEQNLPVLLEVSRQFLVSAKGVPGAASQFDRIARLLDLSGRIEEARNAYLQASAEGSPDSALVSAFLLSFQMNDAESMSATLQELAGKGGSADLLLHALSDMRIGDRAAARAALIGVADQAGSPELALKAIWILYQSDVSSGDPAARAALRSRLGPRFASAPETAIAEGPASSGAKVARAVVVEMPTPVLLDTAPPAGSGTTGTAPAPVVAAPVATAPAAPVPVAPAPAAAAISSTLKASVQAGSFLMKENADDLLSELSKRGFAPVVVRERAQGRDRYRVLAGAGLEAEAAKALLKRLSAEGFSGFIVTEK